MGGVGRVLVLGGRLKRMGGDEEGDEGVMVMGYMMCKVCLDVYQG